MRKYIPALAVFILSALAMAPSSRAWTNPIDLPGLNGRSTGDPYILKYRGYYYLYVSAGDTAIYCRKSKDLMNWSEDMVCCMDPVTAMAYAPEVIYWNGKFYMCTSPRGGGHYMLTADSPEGPFTHQSGNLGRDIDGSMFVDDDGSWYFYHANNEGIRGCEMPTHLSFGDDVDLKCCITGQWTEGPCVFKRNGLYYNLYTGNHVWTPGYRIDYAISDKGPLEGFRPVKEQNPILVDTETPSHQALGHGSAFIGPDLDSYYFVYHNLQDNKRRRLLNFERIGWCGDKLIMTGPTYWEQEAPAVAVNDYFEREEIGGDWKTVGGGKWSVADRDRLTQTERKGRHTAIFEPYAYEDYTAEFTLKAGKTASSAEKSGAPKSGYVGAVFSYEDSKNYSEALINVEKKTFEVNNYVGGKLAASLSRMLPADFDPESWHHLRVEKHGDRTRIYIDGMRGFSLDLPPVRGKIGYITKDCPGDFSYIAVSPYVDGNGILDVSIPVPGILSANLRGSQIGDVTEVAYDMPVGKALYLDCGAGSAVYYKLNVQKDDVYNLGIRYGGEGARVRIHSDGRVVADNIPLAPANGAMAVHTVENLPLKGGSQLLMIEVIEGDVALYDYNFKRANANPRGLSDDFDNGLSELWGYSDGDWKVAVGGLESAGKYGKILMGGYDDIPMTNCVVECDVAYPEGEMNGGLIFRVTNPSIGGADDNPVLGTDFLQGYILMAGPESVTLGKHNFGWLPLVTVPAEVDPGKTHHMKVEAVGDTFRCYLDDMETPLIVYKDPDPFIIGRAGFRAHNSRLRFDNFKIEPIKK